MGDLGKALGGLPIVGGLLGGGGGGSSQPMGYPPGYGQVQSGLGSALGGGGLGGLLGGLLGGGGSGGLGGMLGGLPLIGGMFGSGGPLGGLGGMLGGKGIPTPFGQFNPMNPFGGGFNPMNPWGQQQGAPDWYNKPPSWWNQGPQQPKPTPMLKSPSSMGLQRPPQAQAGGGGNPHVGTVMGDDAGAAYYGSSGASPQTTAASATAPLRSASAFVPRASTYSPPQLSAVRPSGAMGATRVGSGTPYSATNVFGGYTQSMPKPPWQGGFGGF